MTTLRKIGGIIMLLSSALIVLGQEAYDSINRSAEDFINVYLVVAAPSATTYSTLGHDCLRLQCEALGKDYMYSYESENVEEKILSYLKGDLKMGMFSINPQDYIDYYASQHRTVRQYKLNLSPDIETRLWQILDEEVSEGAYLPYDYLNRGCAQSILVFLKRAITPNEIHYGPWPEKYCQTRREFVSSNLKDRHPWVDCMFSLVVGTEADKEVTNEEKVVIPSDLVEVLQHAEIDGTAIISNEPEWLTEQYPDTEYKGITPIMAGIILLLIAIGSIWFKPIWSKTIDMLYLAAITIVGVFIMFVLMGNLPNSAWIWLFIPFNPLPAIGWCWRKYWALAYSMLLVVWIIGMLVYPHTLVNNAYLLFVAAEIVILWKQTKQINRILKKDTKRYEKVY